MKATSTVSDELRSELAALREGYAKLAAAFSSNFGVKQDADGGYHAVIDLADATVSWPLSEADLADYPFFDLLPGVFEPQGLHERCAAMRALSMVRFVPEKLVPGLEYGGAQGA